MRQIDSSSAPKRGLARSSAAERGRGKSTGTIALMRPGCAVITTMRSPSAIASSMPWVMNSTVFWLPSQMLQQLVLQDQLVLRVERGERLVHQQDLGIGHQGAREADALAHAAGELLRIVSAEAGQADHLEEEADLLAPLALGRRRASRG